MAETSARLRRALARTAGLGTLAAAVAFVPPVFTRVFAMAPLVGGESAALWTASALLAAAAGAIGARPRRPEWMLAVCSVLALVALELGARLVVKAALPRAQVILAQLADRTYPERRAYVGHPFLQVIGNPRVALRGNRALGTQAPWNNLGFAGPDMHTAKPAGVIRVACLGGSTTVRGYPELLERYLNGARQAGEAGGDRFEALNFGLGWYSSAHMVVNLVLNVVDFAPDYVVFHEAWNDEAVRQTYSTFRGDYAHAFHDFQEPVIPDLWAIRASVLYRGIKQLLTGEPDWAFLDVALVRQRNRPAVIRYDHPEELQPYERNIRTVVDFGLARGITTVLTTQPHSSNRAMAYSEVAPHIDQCNEIMRRLAAEYGDRVVFVDLDRMMTGTMDEVFEDVAHVSRQGDEFKAARIGDAIRAHRARRAEPAADAR